MEWVKDILAIILVFGTPLLIMAALAFADHEFQNKRSPRRRRIGVPLAAVIASLVMWVANPLFNLLTFSFLAERYRSHMLADAQAAPCAGKTTEWLQERYGRPLQIKRDERDKTLEHWWYTPGPWFIMHEDYVGFTVTKGIVTSAYIQVN